MRCTSASFSSVRRRRFAPIDRALDRTERVRSITGVRVANRCPRTLRANRTIFATPLANKLESDGYATFASITVVSARTRFVFNTFASAARANRASFSSLIARSPHRVVIFINVVGCGAAPPNGIRQNRCQLIESVTSRHNGSKPNLVAVLQEHQPQIRLDRDRRTPQLGVEEPPIRLKKPGSSNSRSTATSSAGIRNATSGKIDSHNVGWSFTVLNTMASIRTSPTGRGHHPLSRPNREHPHHPTFSGRSC